MKSVVKKSVFLLSIVTAASMTLLPFNTSKVMGQSNSQPKCVMTPQPYIAANTLAMMAYRGAFSQEGIPGYLVFKTDFKSGRITAEAIVDAAIAGCVLSNKYGMGDNSAYVEDVEQEVQMFIQSQN